MPYHQADIRDPRASASRPPRQRLDGAQRRLAQFHPLRLRRPDARGPASSTSSGASGPARSACCRWADPVFAAGYARAFQFCGSAGVEVMEPLSFKGRRGSGLTGNRDGARRSAPQLGLGEVPRHLSRLGRGSSTRAPRSRWTRAGRRQPHSADRHDGAHALRGEQQLLAGDLHQPADGGRRPPPVQRHTAPRRSSATSRRSTRSSSRASTISPRAAERRRSGKYSPIEVAQWLEDLAATKAPADVKPGHSAGSSPPSSARASFTTSSKRRGDRAAPGSGRQDLPCRPRRLGQAGE